MYVKALAILLLLSGLIAGGISIYDAGGDAREDKLVREHQAELLRVAKELEQARQAAEAEIAEDRKTHDAGTRIVERITDNCIDQRMPADLIGVFHQDGLYPN